MITTQYDNNNPSVKNNSTFFPSFIPTRLPKLQQRLLSLFYEDFVIFGKENSDRSVKQLSIRFKRHEDTISKALSCLTKLGFITGIHGGSNSKIRWITSGGISYLDNQTPDQTPDQIHPHSYIDLSDPEKIKSEILKEPHPCGQNIDHIQDIDQKLDLFLEQERTAPTEREQIKRAIRASRIGPVRKEELINRVIAANKKKRILDKKTYILASILNEHRILGETFKVLLKNPIPINLYEEL